MNFRSWLIEKLGGFPTIDAAIDAVREQDTANKYRILTLAVKKLFNTISSDDILRIHKPTGEWMYKNRVLSKGERDLLAAEAKLFLGSKLWEILKDDIRYQANRKMFILSKSEIDIIAGKLWTYTLEGFTTRLESLSEHSATFNNSIE